MTRRMVLATGLLAPSWAFALPDPPTVGTRRRYLSGAFGQIHIREALPAIETAPPLVLLHQSPLSGRMFEKILRPLAVDRRVIAVDTPGYGESDRPVERPSAEGYVSSIINTLTEDTASEIDLLGYHTGAGFAAIAAAQMRSVVRRLVLISVPYFSQERRRSILQQIAKPQAFDPDGAYLPPLWKGSYGVKPEGQSLEDVARIVAEKQRPGKYGEWALLSLFERDLTADLQSIQQPTLVMAPHDGLQDESAVAAGLIHDAQYEGLADLAYGLFDAAPTAIASRVLGFLNA